MATVGDRFHMPDGSVYALLRSSADTNGEYVEMEFVLPPGCVPPPPHVHPAQVEDYEVLEGTFEVVVDGEWSVLQQADRASVPVGALHTFRNSSGATARVRNRHTPAMRFEEFIAEIHATLRRAGVSRPRDPRIPMLISMVMLRYGETLYPGRRRERIPMKGLSVLGRLLTR